MKKWVTFLLIIISFAFVSALFNVGGNDLSNKIDSGYSPEAKIKGWMNFSVSEELETSQVEFQIYNITGKRVISSLSVSKNLSEIVNETNLQKTCFPLDCKQNYQTSGSGAESKQETLESGDELIYGLKISGEDFEEFTGFSFNVESDAPESENPQIQIDLLNDEEYEWVSYNSSGKFSDNPEYGCYNSSTTKTGLITSTDSYCNYIKVDKFSPVIKIGAVVSKVGDKAASFNLSVSKNWESNALCNFSDLTASASIDCIPKTKEGKNMSVKPGDELLVCIVAKKGSENQYRIKYYENESCGQEVLNGNNFQLFFDSSLYSPMTNFVFNNTQAGISMKDSGIKLEVLIDEYIYSRYQRNCKDGCIIPIRILSNEAQTIKISNLKAYYKEEGVSTDTTSFYEIIPKEIKYTWNFQQISLDNLGVVVPKAFGNYTLIANFKNKTKSYSLFRSNFSVEKVPIAVSINGKTALTVPAAYLQEFQAKVETYNSSLPITSYIWNFGDGSTVITTASNKTSHTYEEIGVYNLSLTVKNSKFSSSKNFTITAQNPKENVNSFIIEMKKDYSNVNTTLNKLPEFHKQAIKKFLDFDKVGAFLTSIEEKNKTATTDEDYIEIMKNISDSLSQDFPKSILISDQLDNGFFLLNEDSISLEMIGTASQETYNSTREEDYLTEITRWNLEQINALLDYQSYQINYGYGKNETVSFFKISLSADENTTGAYMIFPEMEIIQFAGITQPVDKTSFKYLILDGKAKEIEFATSSLVSPTSLPIFFSPAFSKLKLPEIAAPLERTFLETYKWPIFILLLFVLLTIFIIVYRAAGNWYNKRYEDHLFPNKNQLYNIINYVHASKERGVKDKEISDSLLKAKWSSEQVRYIMRKYAGKNPGMFGMKDPRIKKPQKENKVAKFN